MKKFRLRKLAFDEVSMVPSGDNPPANIVLAKADGDKTHGLPTSGNTLMNIDKKEVVVAGDNVISKDDLPEAVVEYITALEDKIDEQDALLSKSGPDGDDDFEAIIAELVAEGLIEEDVAKGENVAELVKSNPIVQALISKAEARATEAETIAKAERDERLRRDYIAKAEGFKHLPNDADTLGRLLRAVDEKLNPADAEELGKILKAADGALESAKLFDELGSTSIVKGSASLESAAEEIRKTDPSLTREQAIAKALENNPALYEEA